jgi:predicted secreted protein
MGIFSGFVLYAVIWFLTLFVVLPLRMTTQGEAGVVVPGTHASAPANAQMKKRLLVTTIVGTLIWAVVAGVILSGAISVASLDAFYRR